MTRSEYAAEIKEKYVTNGTGDIGERFEVYDALFHTGSKLIEHFGSHERILISVSGGSDSDCIVHLVCTYFPEYVDKCYFVFVNTGLEYEATKRHIREIEERYCISIKEIRGRSVVSVIREHGFPILSKVRSEDIYYYLKGRQWAIDRIDGDANKDKPRYAYNDNMVEMIHYIKQNGLKVSSLCCDKSKKNPIKKFMRENGINLNVTGERKAEGGQRASAHKSCFEEHKDGLHKFMPLWWWSDSIKVVFKKTEKIRYSDCYEVYKLKRTGCVGCPFCINIAFDLQVMYEYEPQLYKACMKVFGKAYELTDKFNCRKKKCLPEFLQMTLTGEIKKAEVENGT